MFGYADLGDGTQVDITDGAGETLALAKLENGRITIHGTIWDLTAQVPDSDFYEVAVADRGSVKGRRRIRSCPYCAATPLTGRR